MKYYLVLLCIILIYCRNIQQTQPQIKVIEIDITDTIKEKSFNTWLMTNSWTKKDSISECYNTWLRKRLVTKNGSAYKFQYEDANYLVYSRCGGEFGGEIIFKDKLTNQYFGKDCTCLKMIEKINNAYFVTETIAHMGGLSKVIKIPDPKKLVQINIDSFSTVLSIISKENPNLTFHQADSILNLNTEIIFDGMGYIVAYFKCEERDYMIYANDSTYLAEIINNRAVNIDTLIRYPIRIIDYFHQRNTKLSKGVQTGILHYKMNDQLCNQFSFYIKNDSIIINKSKMKCY